MENNVELMLEEVKSINKALTNRANMTESEINGYLDRLNKLKIRLTQYGKKGLVIKVIGKIYVTTAQSLQNSGINAITKSHNDKPNILQKFEIYYIDVNEKEARALAKRDLGPDIFGVQVFIMKCANPRFKIVPSKQVGNWE